MSDIESRLSELALQVSTQKGYSDNHRCLLLKALADISKLMGDVQGLKSVLINHQSSVSDAVDSFAKLQGLVAEIRAEFARHHHALSQSVKSSQDDQRKTISEMTSDLFRRMEKLESVLEEISLDSKNALLKASNAEMLVILNRKKVENVQLLVQNQQLQK